MLPENLKEFQIVCLKDLRRPDFVPGEKTWRAQHQIWTFGVTTLQGYLAPN